MINDPLECTRLIVYFLAGMIGSMSDPVVQVSAQLKSRGIVVPRDNEWLIACVECFTSENPNFTPKQLFEFAFEQWTLADLSDVGAPSLPPNCVNCTKMMLTGKYAVQINYFLNVAVPLHKQLQKIRRPDAQKNLEVDNERQERDRDRLKEDTSARTLKMEITDGVTTVIGFEDHPIPEIKLAIPGEKAVLSGPIEVRKGVLMLKPANVTILGGEVDTLLVKNAPENLLARALKQPENPDPYGVNSSLRDTTPLTHPTAAPPRQTPEPTIPASNAIHDAFDDGEDEALASLAEALENDSFHLEDSPISSNSRPSHSMPANRPLIPHTSKNVPNKPSKTSQKPTKQPTITEFLSQPKKANSQVFDVSSEIDDGFDEDFELIAAQTASLAERRASLPKNTEQNTHDPEKLKKQLEATYASTKSDAAVNSRLGAITKPVSSSNSNTKPPECKLPNKRKDPALEYDAFGRLKIPRKESSASSSTSSEAPPFKNPRHGLPQDELMEPDELYDWLPPPPKANLEHVRPSHEKGKILIDYTDPSTLDLDSVPTQRTHKVLNEQKPSITSLEEPFPPKEFPCTRKAMGKVVKVVNKLQLREAKWVLSATVEAKGIELEMDFAPEALDKIFTVTAEEITRQKEHFKTNPELKEKFNGHLRESQRRIQNLCCEMTILFKNFISKPVVLDVSKND